MSDEPTSGRPRPEHRGFARLTTGAKLILILSAALLPLALIAIAAALQTTRTVDLENKARLRVAATESARVLSIELIGDLNALRSALSAIETDAEDAASCARVRGVFANAMTNGVKFEIIGRRGVRRCGDPLPELDDTARKASDATLIPGRGLLLSLAGEDGFARASAFFPTAHLAEISRPSGFQPNYGLRLVADDQALQLRDLDLDSPLAQLNTISLPIGAGAIDLEMRTPAAPITSALVLAMLTPLLMWVAAVGIAWSVVDHMLIRPLRRLRRAVGDYTPGTTFEPTDAGGHSQEIRQLGDTFGNLTRALQSHEADLAEGLIRQTKLTREVHHRVKNNLQVIASLINFHARSAVAPEAASAYSSIQRRVDALSVVHRNHFAEIEVHRGLNLRSVIGELAANIRATAPERSSQLGIVLEIPPLLVTQDIAVAVAFLVTELVEMALGADPIAQIRISARASEGEGAKATLRVSSKALVESAALQDDIAKRYGRIIEGLARQLRSKLHYDPLVGAYEVTIAITGSD